MKLGVNIDHVATLRQARGVCYPDVVEAGLLCERQGVYGITVHLREDRRHIQDADVFALKEVLSIPLNLEMANSSDIVEIALQVQPKEVCLVPEKREELTTEGGLDVCGQKDGLRETVYRLSDVGIEVSMFIDPEPDQIQASVDIGAPVIELHTGTYCDASGAAAEAELRRLREGACLAHELGLVVNAGHGITVGNLPGVLTIPHLNTLNIGHSLVARSVFVGLGAAVEEMMLGMAAYTGGEVV